MKKILLIVALIFSLTCLSACKNNQRKATVFDCSYYLVTRNTQGFNMLESYDSLQLVFYSDGKFSWVGSLKDTTLDEEVFSGTYVDKEEKVDKNDANSPVKTYRYLTYNDNKIDEFPQGGVTPKYLISDDGKTLTRDKQLVLITLEKQIIISQEFNRK